MTIDIYKQELENLWIKQKVHLSNIRHLNYSHLSKEIIKPRQILWHLLNDINEIPKCKNIQCNNKAIWTKRKYTLFCSQQCSAKTIETKQKRKITNLEKYGVEHVGNSKEIQEKRKQTNLERYGTVSPLGNKEVQEKPNKQI